MARPKSTSSRLPVLLGFHAVRARLKAAPHTLREVLYVADRKDARLKTLLDALTQAGVASRAVDSGRLDQEAQGERHQGILALAEAMEQPADLDSLLEQLQTADQPPLLVLLDGVTDPHNLGAVLRAADGAGVSAVIAPKDRSAPLSDIARRVSAGASESLPYIQITNLTRAIERLQDEGYRVLGLAGEARESIYQTDLQGPLALALGAEGEGLRRLVREQCDGLVKLPLLGQVESLNVSVACAVACYEAVRQRERF
ncbi:MAG: rRNA (guanosine-2-O-)-methyltransferase RlmB [Pseudomonadota bacterium]